MRCGGCSLQPPQPLTRILSELLRRQSEGLLAGADVALVARLGDQRGAPASALLSSAFSCACWRSSWATSARSCCVALRAFRYERTGPTQSTTGGAAARPLRGGGRGAGGRCGRGGGGRRHRAPLRRLRRCSSRLPHFRSWKPRPQRDREAIERQLGRPPRALAGVAARCSHGGPSVIAQRPYDEAGTPFPTTLWLSCRVLVRAVERARVGRRHRRAGARARRAARACAAAARLADRRVAALRAALDSGRAARRWRRGAERRASTAGRTPHRSSACTPTPPPRSATPPYAFGRLVLERAQAPAPESCCAWA